MSAPLADRDLNGADIKGNVCATLEIFQRVFGKT